MAVLLSSLVALLGVVNVNVRAAKPATCAEVKTLYKDSSCCGNPAKAVTVDPSCPYNFNKPACKDAEAQAPRDLTTGASGSRVPKSIVLNKAQAAAIPLVNVHFHLGAEHKSDSYMDATDSNTFDASGGRRLAAGAVRPGFMCPAPTAAETSTPFTFQYCKGQVQVGKSYEIHYVHSSAGYTAAEIAANANIDGMDDGLGGAANGRGQLNPMVVVQAQVFQIVTGTSAPTIDDMVHGWQNPTTTTNKVMYPGSTTGPSHTNSVCSPYAISWHVDKACHKVSAASFDNMCKMMKDQYNLNADLYPHGSREILSTSWVVPASHVVNLA